MVPKSMGSGPDIVFTIVVSNASLYQGIKLDAHGTPRKRSQIVNSGR